jgi:hypothetical protein
VGALAPTPLGQADPERAQVRPARGATPAQCRSDTDPMAIDLAGAGPSDPQRTVHRRTEGEHADDNDRSQRPRRPGPRGAGRQARPRLPGGQVVADTTRRRLVWEVPYYPAYYFPLADVRTDLLVATATVTHSPSRGDAQHFTVKAGGKEAVVAPSWQVDDFAPFLLITFLFAVHGPARRGRQGRASRSAARRRARPGATCQA